MAIRAVWWGKMNYLREMLASRELLINLTMREVKGKYKRTVFGQLWSLANPLALMLIYTFVFAFIIRIELAPGDPSGLNVFAIWLLCGLLPWIFFANVLNSGVTSLVSNAGLIQKVADALEAERSEAGNCLRVETKGGQR